MTLRRSVLTPFTVALMSSYPVAQRTAPVRLSVPAAAVRAFGAALPGASASAAHSQTFDSATERDASAVYTTLLQPPFGAGSSQA